MSDLDKINLSALDGINPALTRYGKEEPAPVLPLREEPDLLSWLETSGRLVSDQDSNDQEISTVEEEELSALMGEKEDYKAEEEETTDEEEITIIENEENIKQEEENKNKTGNQKEEEPEEKRKQEETTKMTSNPKSERPEGSPPQVPMYFSNIGTPGYLGAHVINLEGLWAPNLENGNNVEDAIDILNLCKTTKQYRDETALILAFLDKNGALKYMKDLTAAQRSELSAFCDWLRNFSKADETYYQVKLKQFKQGTKAYRGYFIELCSLYRKAHSKTETSPLTESDKKKIKKLFIRGITDKKIQQHLAVISPTNMSFDDEGTGMVDHAENLKIALRDICDENLILNETKLATEAITQVAVKTQIDTFKNNMEEITEKMKTMLDSATTMIAAGQANNQRNYQRRDDLICWNCNGRGHKASECCASPGYRRQGFKRNSRGRGFNQGYQNQDSRNFNNQGGFNNQYQQNGNNQNGYYNQNNRGRGN